MDGGRRRRTKEKDKEKEKEKKNARGTKDHLINTEVVTVLEDLLDHRSELFRTHFELLFIRHFH